MTLHRTPNTVSTRTMHSHPCHAMSSCTCNAIMLIAYMYNHPCTHTHTYLRFSMPIKMSYSTYPEVIFHTSYYQLKPYTAHINMSYSTLHVINSSHNTQLNRPALTCLILNVLHGKMAEILTQWEFHRVQEHPNRNSDEKVITFRSWRSHMTKLSHPGSPPYLSGRPFPASSDTQCPPKRSFWKVNSMGFP